MDTSLPASADLADRLFTGTPPGQAPAAASAPGAGPASAALPSSDLPEILSGSNPLVTAANHLLNFIPQIRALAVHPDPSALRNYLVQEIRRFEALVRQYNIAPETVIGARYCLCTALDETAAQTPWGGSGAWGKHSLLVTFHNETWGGEKFFQLLAKLAQEPQRHADLLELMYFCIALGFEGRYRIIDNGRLQLDALNQRLTGMLQTARSERESGLSPHWRGVAAAGPAQWQSVPFWIVTAGSALLALMLYLMFTFWLSGTSDRLFGEINNLRMPRVSVVAPRPAVVPRMRSALASEVEQGLLEVRDEADRSIVVLRGDGLFESGSATVRPQYLPVLVRIGDALRSTQGQVLVSGYTDNTPIHTLRFPSNWQLSQTRAQAVQQLLEPALGNRIRAEGRADADAIASNSTAEGRALNRRVEITLLLTAADARGTGLEGSR